MQSVAQFGFNTIIQRKKSFHASIISLLESVYQLDVTISLQSSLTLSRVKVFRSKGQINGFPALSNLFIRIRPGLHLHDKYKHEKKCQWTNVGREMHLIFLWLCLVPTSKLISTATGNLTPGSLFSMLSETWRGETLGTRLNHRMTHARAVLLWPLLLLFVLCSYTFIDTSMKIPLDWSTFFSFFQSPL